mmetsp:Transcript_7686/g.11192  ORF Transcript_7686/g.11192 Transcript_7686/m.11192 type:complete len:81 (+) Transcript_7686:175-417(+)
MATKKIDRGLDPKSLAINLATTLVFIIPFVIYYDNDVGKKFCMVTGGSLLLAFLVPPIGWMRPHPYTDMPGNRPYPRRDD